MYTVVFVVLAAFATGDAAPADETFLMQGRLARDAEEETDYKVSFEEDEDGDAYSSADFNWLSEEEEPTPQKKVPETKEQKDAQLNKLAVDAMDQAKRMSAQTGKLAGQAANSVKNLATSGARKAKQLAQSAAKAAQAASQKLIEQDNENGEGYADDQDELPFYEEGNETEAKVAKKAKTEPSALRKAVTQAVTDAANQYVNAAEGAAKGTGKLAKSVGKFGADVAKDIAKQAAEAGRSFVKGAQDAMQHQAEADLTTFLRADSEDEGKQGEQLPFDKRRALYDDLSEEEFEAGEAVDQMLANMEDPAAVAEREELAAKKEADEQNFQKMAGEMGKNYRELAVSAASRARQLAGKAGEAFSTVRQGVQRRASDLSERAAEAQRGAEARATERQLFEEKEDMAEEDASTAQKLPFEEEKPLDMSDEAVAARMVDEAADRMPEPREEFVMPEIVVPEQVKQVAAGVRKATAAAARASARAAKAGAQGTANFAKKVATKVAESQAKAYQEYKEAMEQEQEPESRELYEGDDQAREAKASEAAKETVRLLKAKQDNIKLEQQKAVMQLEEEHIRDLQAQARQESEAAQARLAMVDEELAALERAVARKDRREEAAEERLGVDRAAVRKLEEEVASAEADLRRYSEA